MIVYITVSKRTRLFGSQLMSAGGTGNQPMMLASAYLALATLAQNWEDHAISEPLKIIMSDGCNRPVSPLSSLIVAH